MYDFSTNNIKQNFTLFSQPEFLIMIQRIQTIYFIAIIIICATLCSGSAIKVTQTGPDNMITEYNLNLFHYKVVENGIQTINEVQIILIALVSIEIGRAHV